MEVSAKKSKVLAGRLQIAEEVAFGFRTKKISPTTHAKLLGTDSVGVRRRSTATFQERLRTFGRAAPKFHALRRSGANSKQMVRAAGTPAYEPHSAGITIGSTSACACAYNCRLCVHTAVRGHARAGLSCSWRANVSLSEQTWRQSGQRAGRAARCALARQFLQKRWWHLRFSLVRRSANQSAIQRLSHGV